MASSPLLTTLLLCALAYSAPACSETFCPLSWVRLTQRGDGICDLPCNTAFCDFDGAIGQDFSTSDCYQDCALTTSSYTKALGNSECQPELGLESEVCGWDAGDCGYCAAGCRTYLGFETDLGNGVCKEACNTLTCGFDGGDCVPSRQGTCNSGCFQIMLEDQVCQPECLVKGCQYDKGACEASLCAAGCYPDMQGDDICQSKCYSDPCSWDLSDCNCAPGCSADMLGNGICNSACYVETCEWDRTDCECAQGCPYTEFTRENLNCQVLSCNFGVKSWSGKGCADGTAVDCELACSAGNQQLPLGCVCTGLVCENLITEDKLESCMPFNTPFLYFPFNPRVLPDISSAEHPVAYYVASDADDMSSGSPEDPFSLNQAFNQVNQMYVDFLLRPGIYSTLSPNLLDCCNVYSQLNWNSELFKAQPSYYLSKRVRVKSEDCEEWRIDCQRPSMRLSSQFQCVFRLFKDFSLEYTNVDFEMASDTSSFCTRLTPCAPVFFHVPEGSALRFTNVTFRNLRSSPYAIFSLVRARLELNNVDFLNIGLTMARDASYQAIIASNSIAEVVYRKGKVSLLGNSEAIKSDTNLQGFLSINQGSVLLEGVVFSYNFVADSFALINVLECSQCTIANCTFENNFATVIRYAATGLKAFSSAWEEAETIANRSLEIVNCVFRNNTGQQSSSIIVRFGSVLHQITVRNCSFINEYAEKSGILAINSTGFSTVLSEGYWKLVYSSASKPHNVSFPPVRISLQDLTFVNCTVGNFGLLLLSRLPRLLLSNITLSGYGLFRNVNRFTTTLNAFALQPGGNLPTNLPIMPLAHCLSIVNVTDVRDLVISGLKSERFECDSVVHLAGCGSRMSGLVARQNVVSEAVLFTHSPFPLIINGIDYSANRNDRLKGIIHIADLLGTASVSNGLFVGNKALYGGVFYCPSMLDFSVTNSTFRDNSAEFGGVLYMELAANCNSSVRISASAFTGNTASTLGGVLAFTLAEGSSSLSFLISDSTFTESSSAQGSVLFISKLVLLQQGLVTDSLIGGNRASEVGTFHLAAGSLSLVNSGFERNSAEDGSGVYRDCSSSQSICALSCSNVSLLSNSGAAVISLLPSFQQKTFTALHLLCKGNSGSCLSLFSTSANCDYCELSGNSAASGAGFLLFGSTLTMKYGKFRENMVQGNGGVGVLDAASYALCQQCEFVSNTANRQGGVLYLKDSEIAILSSNFSRNTALEGGFALSLYRSTANITNTQVSWNFGLGIGSISSLLSKINFTSCLFADNEYSKLTGGINVFLSDVVINTCEFARQNSYSGSFLYVSQSTVVIVDSKLSEGWAASSGGAATLLASTAELRGCVLSNLTAQLGAALFLQSDSTLLLNRCDLKNIAVRKTDRGVINGYRSSVQVISSNFTNFTQSAVAGEDIELSLLSSVFQQAVGNNGGAVSCIDCRRVHISASVFRNLSAESRGGALYLAGSSAHVKEMTLENLIVEGCEAPEGGAIFAENCSLAIVGSVFTNNKALGSGGEGAAVLLVARTSDIFEVRNSSFTGNSAGLSGGAIRWRGTHPSMLNNNFHNNSAQYGSNVASFPVKLALTSESPANIPNCASGQSANITLLLELLDHYGQRVTSDNSSFALLTSANSATAFGGTTQVLASMGLFILSSFSIVSPPGLNTSLTVNTTAPSILPVNVLVFMRKCVLGEAETNGQCVPCAYGSYNLEAGTSCKNCPASAYCYGNYSIGPRAGYWRAHNSSDILFPCPYSEACLGSSTALEMAGECAEGYEGNMCQTCSIGYFRRSRVRCSQCPNSLVRTIGQLVLWIVIIILLVLWIKLSLKAEKSDGSFSSIHIKIFLNYLQLVMLFDSFNLAWPDIMLELFNAQEAVGGFPEFLFSFNCLYAEETELQAYERKLIVLSLLQLLLVAVSTGIWTGVSLCRRSLSYLKNQAVGAGIVLFFVAFPSVMRVMLGVLHCKEILPGEHWVVGLDIRCWTPYHLKYALGLALPSLLLWGLSVPLLIFLLLYRQKQQCSDPVYQMRYSFLTVGYQPNRFYWEFVIIYRKTLIIAFIVFFAQVSLFLQALSTLGILLVSATLQSFLRPYCQSFLNSLELRSLLATILTLYSGLFFYNETLGTVGTLLLFTFITVVNIAFTLLCLLKLGLSRIRNLTSSPVPIDSAAIKSHISSAIPQKSD